MKTCISTVDSLLLVNAAHPLATLSDPDLVRMDDRFPEIRLERRTAGFLNACIREVAGEHVIVPVSGWRSQEEQQEIWEDTLAKEGEAFTRRYVALPGCSEHQTGLAVDLGMAAKTIDFIRPHFPYDGLCGAFRKRAADYGFVLRYPAGKEAVTGIAEEPWHFRYVGVPHARYMAERDLCLEEYIVFLRQKHFRHPLIVCAASHTFRIRYCDEIAQEDLSPESGSYFQVSADNCGGFIVTAWR